MGDTSIRVSEETKKRLDLARREGESFDDVIRRLASGDKWQGFGALADEPGNTREGLARMRREMRDGIDGDLDEMESE